MTPKRETIRNLMKAVSNIDATYAAGTYKTTKKDPAFWLMYALDDGEEYSQKKLCEVWKLNKTTLNTNIKKCEAAEYLELKPIPGERREMQICLTESGNTYAKGLLEAVYRAEDKAMEETLQKYSEEFISALNYYAESLRRAFGKEKMELEHLALDPEASNE